MPKYIRRVVKMEVGARKSFVYIPSMGFIEVCEAREEGMEGNNQELSEKEMMDIAIRRRLEREYPGCEIIQDGDSWSVNPKGQA